MAQAFWVLLLLVVMSFALRRFLPGDIPNSFVWVITALVFGIGGAILAGYGAATDATWLHDLGRGLVLQGMMTGLVIGVGGVLLPAITRGEHRRPVWIAAWMLPPWQLKSLAARRGGRVSVGDGAVGPVLAPAPGEPGVC